MVNRRLIRLAGAQRLFVGLAAAAGVIGGLVTIVQARLVSSIIDRVFLGHQGLRGVAVLLSLSLVVVVGRALTVWAGEVVGHEAAARTKLLLRDRLMAHLFALGPGYTRRQRTGELVTTVIDGIENLEDYIRLYLSQIAISVLVPAAILAVVFPLDPLSGLVLLLTLPVMPVLMALVGTISSDLTRRQWSSLSRMSAHLLDVVQGLTTLKVLGRSQAQVEIVGRISEQFRRATLRVLRVAFLSSLVLELTATLSTAVVAVEIGVRLMNGGIAFSSALFVLLLAPEYYLPLRVLGVRYHAAASGVSAADRIFGVLDVPQAGRMPATGQEPDVPLLREHAIRFEDVSFAYDEGRQALEDVSFTIEPGEHVALVGPSGAGKTTIAHLLLRFLEPQRGCIMAGDVPFTAISAEDWRRQVAWVSQDPYIFHDTIEANIRLARADATTDEVQNAAEQARASEFISALSLGYDTPVSINGEGLSGGQAQRIAIARAFLKDAPLLILDEATAHLDPETESGIQEALTALTHGRTVLTIAHRLRTVMAAKRIIVLDCGRVAGIGTHAELLATCDVYRTLVGAYTTDEKGEEVASAQLNVRASA